MHFSRLASFSAVALALGHAALAIPAKRDIESDVSTVLDTLTSTVTPILTEISGLSDASESTLSPLITDLTTAFSTAASDLPTVSVSLPIVKRQTVSSITDELFGIITATVSTLESTIDTETSGVDLTSLLTPLDTAISDTVTGVEGAIPEAETLITTELADSSGVVSGLEALSMGLTSTALGLAAI